MPDEDIHPEAEERKDEAYWDPKFKDMTARETLKYITDRFPSSDQLKREEREKLGFATDIKLGCMNLGTSRGSCYYQTTRTACEKAQRS